MKNAYIKDVTRTIQRSTKRFIAILAITVLGITVFSGIYAACKDMYLGADAFYDEQRMFDIRILSTLGLTADDVTELEKVKDVQTADGAYSETVYITVDDARQTAEVIMLSPKGINTPFITEGTLPAKAGEIAVTEKYMKSSGKSVGDFITIEEDIKPSDNSEIKEKAADDDDFDVEFDIDAEEAEKPNFKNTAYTITGIVIDPLDVANNEGTTAFRSTAATDYTFFVTPDDVDTDVYTAVYLTLQGVSKLDCYSDEYKEKVQDVICTIEDSILKQREQARYDSVMDEALHKIADGEKTMNEKFAEADKTFADSWAELEKAKKDLADGEAKLTKEENDALQKLADARKEIEDGKAALADERLKAENAFAEAEKAFNTKQAELDSTRNQLTSEIQGVKVLFADAWPEPEWNTLIDASAQKASELITADSKHSPDPAQVGAATVNEQNALTSVLGAYISAHPDMDSSIIGECVSAGLGIGIVEGGQQALDSKLAAFAQQKATAEKQLDDAQAELYDGEVKLDTEEKDALKRLSDAWEEIKSGKQELAEGESELKNNEEKYKEKQTQAKEKISNAYAELDNIELTQWYVNDRTSVDSYSGLNSDLSSINAIGDVFPILFIVVAILISLTTMTRMIEEERGLIGTYKALGFGSFLILWKYLFYALAACLIGGVLGNFMGFVVLPKLLLLVLSEIYTIPGTTLHFDLLKGLTGTLLFTVSILGATALACQNELRQTPAALMRPKAPRAGSRILLERISFIWMHLKFLNKVTARNLFRYKKRLLMTVFGIAGCTALILTGFAIKDSVSGLIPKQYEQIYCYDLMVVSDVKDYDKMADMIESKSDITDYLPAHIESVKVINQEERSETVQMIVVPNDRTLDSYIHIKNLSGARQTLNDTGVLITENAAGLLGVRAGDSIKLQDMQLNRQDAAISGTLENYLGNSIYMTQSYYESLFGAYKPNGAYANLSDKVSEQTAYAEAILDDYDFILSSVSTSALKESFTTDFAILNYVIYGLIFFAAVLAFVVLFTLANTNISERVRELATIKVLGFFDREVHTYVNKETIILSLIGIICGLPFGYALSGLLLNALKMPSLQFSLTIQPVSYLVSGLIAFSFALVVNLITNRTLDKIDMVEALKSIE